MSIKLRSNAEFLGWAATKGIGPDPRYGGRQSLMFLDHGGNPVGGIRESHKFPIALPSDGSGDPRGLAGVVINSFRLLTPIFDQFDSPIIWIWRRGGKWPQRPDRRKDFLFALYSGVIDSWICAGAPVGEEGALHAQADDFQLAQTLVFLNSIIARSTADDLFIVPEKAHMIAHFDHDEFIHIYSR